MKKISTLFFALSFFAMHESKAQCSPDVTPPTVDGYSPVNDQECLVSNTCMANFAQADLAQSFTPSQSTICGAAIYLTSGTGSEDITIRLFDNLPNTGGNQLATGTATGITSGMWAEVNWSSVSITPGNTYYLVFTSTGTSLCIGGTTANDYPGGMVFANSGYSPFSTYDYTFQVFSHCPSNVLEACPGVVNYNLAYSDNCSTATPTFVSGTPSGSTLTVGSYQANYSIVDVAGNTRLFTLDVEVQDNDAPIPDLASLATVTELCEASVSAPTATDNCAGSITGTTSTIFPVTSNTTITWSFDDGNGNISTQDQDIIITGIDINTSTSGLTISADNSNATYQWVDCADNFTPIAGEISQNFTASVNGSYAVILNESGCIDTSECVNITTVGLSYLNLNDNFQLYPNPTSSELMINSKTFGDIEVYNLAGQLVLNTRINSGIQILNVNGLAAGTYSIRLISSEGVVVNKFSIVK